MSKDVTQLRDEIAIALLNVANRSEAMIRISLPWIIQVVSAVDALGEVKAEIQFGQAFPYTYFAHNQLGTLLDQSLYAGSIVSARQSAEELRQLLTDFLARAPTETLSALDGWNLTFRREQFKTVLMAELATLPTYFVKQKPPYSTETLLSAGENLMPPELTAKVPEAIFDVRECGRCLAYETGTACAFHAFRALEAVVRRYFSEVCHGQSAPKQRNLGTYIRAMEKSGVNQKVISALAQLKDLHRNPIAHPEAAITLDEAITIVGLVRSAIATMLIDLPPVPPTTLGAAPTV